MQGMKNPSTQAVILLAALMAGSALAQQTPAEKPAQAAPAKAPATTQKSTASTAARKSDTVELKTPKDKASYAVGIDIGKTLKKNSIDVDPAIMMRGIKDVLADKKPLMTDEEARASLTALQQEARAKQEAKMKAIADENKKEGETFLAANKSKEGVVTLNSGLQYKVETQGTGPKPLASDTVECNYRGTLINGKEFDSSYKRGQPASFPVGGVIKGWTEVLQLMPVGSKYQVFIPADLAYGARGAGADIGPNSTLIFEVELLSIKKPAEATKPAEPAKPAEATTPADTTKPAEPAKPTNEPAKPAEPQK
jgi:FKBP-type peptidyl-prolyl cis-trans isomerase FklB